MALVMNATDKLTAIEAARRNGVTEDQRRIIEALASTNEILLDAPVDEANDMTEETHVVRTALPHGEHRTFYKGVGSVASQTKTVHDTICELGAWSKIDKRLVESRRNPGQFVTDENIAVVYGMGEDQASDIVYGNHIAVPAEINGFAMRRPSIDGKLCINMGGTGDALTSIYIVKWGRATAKLIYPKGAKGIGVDVQDYGDNQTDKDSNGAEYPVVKTYFSAQYGLSVMNEKALIRIANINATTIDAAALIKQILSAKHYLAAGDGTISVYANADILSKLDIATVEKSNVIYNVQDAWGKDLTMIRDMRLRQVDAIVTESLVS